MRIIGNIIWVVVVTLFIAWLILQVGGCSVSPSSEYFQAKLSVSKEHAIIEDGLNRMIQMDNVIGAIGTYNTGRYSGVFPVGQPPTTNQVDWMNWRVMTYKIRGY